MGSNLSSTAVIAQIHSWLNTWTDGDVDEELEGGVDDEAEAGGADDHVVDVEQQDVTEAVKFETQSQFRDHHNNL